MKMFESFDPVKLQTLIDNFDKLVLPNIDQSKNDIDIIRKTLIKYQERSINGSIVVNYHQIRNQGRYFANGSLSLQCLKRSVRHTISTDFYQDIDVVNAHPIILEQLAKMNKFDCPALTSYNQNRDKYLNETSLGRDKTKTLYLVLTNSDDIDADLETKHLRDYSKEMRKLHNEFVNKFSDKYEEFKKIKTDSENPKSAFVNSLLCDTENKILMAMYEYFEKPNNAVLCFDGIMIPKNITVDIKECEKHIKESTKFSVNLKIKEMDEVINLSKVKLSKPNIFKLEYFSDIRKFAGKEIDKEHLDEWVKKCIKKVVKNGVSGFQILDLKSIDKIENNQTDILENTITLINYETELVSSNDFEKTISAYSVYVINPEFDYNFQKENPKSKDIRASKYLFENLGYINGGFHKCGYLDYHIKNGHILAYFGIDFIPHLKIQPDRIPEHILNRFTNFKYDTNLNEVETSLFTNSKLYNHLKTDFFRNDEGELNHFLDHIADIIQDGAQIKASAHLFYSKQGTGKGLLSKFMIKLLDETNVIIFGNPEIYFKNQFNSLNTCKLLKIFEELGDGGGAYKHNNVLKAEVAQDMERIEAKNKNAFIIRHVARYWFFTNNKNGLYIENDDRRYTLHHISEEHANNTEYFEPIAEEINNNKIIHSAFKFFATRKYDKYSARSFYDTKFKQSEKLSQLPNGLKFLVEYIANIYEKGSTNKINFAWNELKEAYNAYCISNGIKYNAGTLETQLSKIDINKNRITVDNKRVQGFSLSCEDIENKIALHLKMPDYKIIPTDKPEKKEKEKPKLDIRKIKEQEPENNQIEPSESTDSFEETETISEPEIIKKSKSVSKPKQKKPKILTTLKLF